MATSEARIRANQMNAKRSTGPSTPPGKERARANSLKHGLTGAGVVLAECDAAEVQRRSIAFRAQLAPQTELGEILVDQMAMLSVRMQRGVKQEFASVASRVRNAAEAFDEERYEQAEALLDGIGENPRSGLRKIRRSPEGVDLIVETWKLLRARLTRLVNPGWKAEDLVLAANLLGIRQDDARDSQLGLLAQVCWGEFAHHPALDPALVGDEAGRKAWARAQLIERIDQTIAELEEHRESLDFEAIEQDRAEAGARALFDPSKEACLARRYEAEAQRGFFRALQEFRKVEAEAQRTEPSTDASQTPEITSSRPPEMPLGSSREKAMPSPRTMPPVADRDASLVKPAAHSYAKGLDGQVLAIGQPSPR